MRVISVEQMKYLEKSANGSDYTYAMMMQKAGDGIAELIDARFDKFQGPILGLVGGGNNGGDTLLALAALQQLGWMTFACLLKDRDPKDSELQKYLDAAGTLVSSSRLVELSNRVKVSLILDGAIGTGFKPPISEALAQALTLSQRLFSSAQWIAVDCPSGIDCSTGLVSSCTPKAELTISLEAIKTGLLSPDAFPLVGELAVVDLGLWIFLPEEKDLCSVVSSEEVKGLLPDRPRFSHKGSFGKVLVIGGSSNYCGAPILSGKGAYAVGVGLVQAAVPSEVYEVMAGANPEFTWLPLDEFEAGTRQGQENTPLEADLKVDSIVIGPGMGKSKSAENLLTTVLFKADPSARVIAVRQIQALPTVIDADALNILAGIHEWEKRLVPGHVLTPHPGEMARLAGRSIEDVESYRNGVAREFAKKWKQTVVLKGPLTVVADPDGQVKIIPIATSALAKGGSGDVLAGIIAGYLAQGMRPGDASILAAWVHARAGEIAVQNVGAEESVSPLDVIRAIPHVIHSLKE